MVHQNHVVILYIKIFEFITCIYTTVMTKVNVSAIMGMSVPVKEMSATVEKLDMFQEV